MAMTLPDIDFRRIRPAGQPASKDGGFEELVSILIEDVLVDWPAGTEFARFGNPDGGREGQGKLPDGRVWAWQAKYLDAFDASAVAQIGRSIDRALQVVEGLERFFVALPMDLPAGDTARQKSANTRWTEAVEEWTAKASARGLAVEFNYIGAHELTKALTREGQEGRVSYWFDRESFSLEWQSRRVEEAIARVGKRYSPEVHIDVPCRSALDAVGRSEEYVQRWREGLAHLRSSRGWGWHVPQDAPKAVHSGVRDAIDSLDAADAAATGAIAAASATKPIPSVGDVFRQTTSALRELEDLLYEHCRSSGGYFVDEAATLY